MNPFLILLVGMAVVIGGILVFRLHAFLALLLGALIVAALTSPDAVVHFALDQGMQLDEAHRLARTPLAERVLAIVSGGTMAHSLVPPTPGPLFMASELRVDLGLMIVAGTVVGLLTAASGYAFAVWANQRWDLPLRESPEALRHLETLSKRETSRLPSLGFSLLPILLPVALIAGSTTLTTLEASPDSGSG